MRLQQRYPRGYQRRLGKQILLLKSRPRKRYQRRVGPQIDLALIPQTEE